jgi:hypothetical protein
VARSSSWLLLLVLAGCTPLEAVDRFDGEFGAAKQQRRILALASPT